jgi:hypothetical protein
MSRRDTARENSEAMKRRSPDTVEGPPRRWRRPRTACLNPGRAAGQISWVRQAARYRALTVLSPSSARRQLSSVCRPPVLLGELTLSARFRSSKCQGAVGIEGRSQGHPGIDRRSPLGDRSIECPLFRTPKRESGPGTPVRGTQKQSLTPSSVG